MAIETIGEGLTDEGKRMVAEYAAEKTANLAIPKEEFCARFKAHMLKMTGEKFDDGESIADYADATAPSYWEDAEQRQDGPEECADSDIGYWGE